VARQPAGVEDRVALVLDVVQVAALGVPVEPIPVLVVDDVVADLLRRVAGVVRGVDAVPMAPVRRVITVVIDETAVDLGVVGAGAGQHALRGVPDDEVDQLDVVADDLDALAAARRLAAVVGPARRVRVVDLESPVPRVVPVNLERREVAAVVAVDLGALAGVVANGDRRRRGSVEVGDEEAGVRAAPHPDRVAGVDRRRLVERGLQIPRAADRSAPARRAAGTDVEVGGGEHGRGEE
jgi:hypothetical protein